MAIKETVTVTVKAKGAKKAASSINQVAEAQDKVSKAGQRTTRSQINVGKATANVSRQFGAQQAGLGGLVATYAGAAATIFAVQQAFSALARAAAAEQTLAGLQTLSAAIGESGDELLAQIQKITKGQLDMVEAAENVNIALGAGFNTKQLEGLTEVALRASRALGRSLPDAFNRLVRGTAKLEPELLDELGIFTRIDPAVEKYAAQLGKAATQLTGFERRQAFVNEAIDEGARKFAAINITAPTSAEAIEKLGATIIDMGVNIGIALSKFIAPFANFISGDMSNAIALFTILLGVIAAKGISVATTAIAGLSAKVTDLADKRLTKLIARSPEAAIALGKINKEVTTLNQQFIKGSTAAATRSFIELGNQGKITAGQIGDLKTSIKGQVEATETAIAKNQTRIGGLQELSKKTAKQTKDLGILEKAQKRQTINLTKQQASLKSVVKLEKEIGANALKTNQLLRRSATAFTTATTALGNFISKLSIWIVVASVVVLGANKLLEAFDLKEAFQRAGKGIVEFTKNLFGFTEEARLTKLGIEGLAAGLIELEQNIPKTFKIKGLLDFRLFDVTRTTEELGDIVGDAIKEVSKKLERASTKGEVIVVPINLNFDEEGLLKTAKKIAEQALFGEQLVIPDKARLEEIGEDLIQSILKPIREKFPAEMLVIFEKALRRGIKLAPIAQQLQQFAEASSQTLGQIIRDLNIEIIKSKEFGQVAILSGKEILTTQFKIIQGEEAQNKVKFKGLSATQRGLDLLKELNLGNISAEGITKARLTVLTLINNALKEAAKLEFDSNTNLTDSLILLREQFDVINSIAEQQIAIEQVTKAVRDTFSSEIAAASKLTGIIDENAKLAETQLEARSKQVELLTKIIGATQIIVETQRAGAKLEKEDVKLVQQGLAAENALVGLFLRSIEAVKKINDQLEIRLQKIKAAGIEQGLKDEVKNIIIRIKGLQQEIKFRNQNANAAKDLLRIEEQITQQQFERTKAIRETTLALREQALQARLDIVSGPLGEFFSDVQLGQIEIQIAQASLQKLEEITRLSIAEANRLAQVRTKEINTEIAVLERNIITRQKVSAEELTKLAIQKNLDVARTKAQEEAQLLEVDRLDEQLSIIEIQAGALRDHVGSLQKAFINHALLIREANGEFRVSVEEQGRGITRESRREKVRAELTKTFVVDIENKLTKPLAQARVRLNEFGAAVTRNASLQLEARKMQFDSELKLLGARGEAAERAIEDQIATLEKTKGLTEAEKVVKIQALEDALALTKDLTAQQIKLIEVTNNVFIKTLSAVAAVVKDEFGQGLRDLNRAFLDGTLTMRNFKEGFRDFLDSLITSVQDAIFEETIVKPVQDFIGGLFGTLVPDGTLNNPIHVRDVDRVAGKFKQLDEMIFDDDAVTEKVDNIFDRFLDKGTQVFKDLGKGITDIFAEVGKGLTFIFTSILNSFSGAGGGGGIGGFLSSLFTGGSTGGASAQVAGDLAGGVALLSPFSQGGLVQKLAHGGAVRDRVPALLEPGEFVLRKEAVRQIGLTGAQSLNRGTDSPFRNLQVVIRNEGTPQENVGQPKIDIDPEKLVISVVTRDLESNGPIRQSLKGLR